MRSGVAGQCSRNSVTPGGRSGSPIVAAEAEHVERTRRKTWSGARSEVIVPYEGSHYLDPNQSPILPLACLRRGMRPSEWTTTLALAIYSRGNK
jgi:hypothetical protein